MAPRGGAGGTRRHGLWYYWVMAGVVKSVYTGDLKSPGRHSLAGSSPAPGTVRCSLTGPGGATRPVRLRNQFPR